MAKMTLKGAAKHSVKGWGAVLTGGILLAVLALVDLPRDGTTTGTATADGSTGCQLQVTAAELRVRSGPSIEHGPARDAHAGSRRRRHDRGHRRLPQAQGQPLGGQRVPRAGGGHRLLIVARTGAAAARAYRSGLGRIPQVLPGRTPVCPDGPHRCRSGPWCHAGMAHRNVDLVTTALAEGGADPARIARMTVLPDAVTTAAAAAAALGVEVGQIANSLVFDADGEPLLVLTSGAHRVDTGKVAALVGAQKVRRASPEFVRAATGQAIGGVAPVGHPARCARWSTGPWSSTTRSGPPAASRTRYFRRRAPSW